MATFQNRTRIVEALLHKAKADLYQYEVAEWVNQKTTKDQFTALHYSSFKGNIVSMQALMDNGADMYARN
jgi:hypothetical protein